MVPTLAAVLLLAAGLPGISGQQVSQPAKSPLTAEQQQQVSKMPVMSEEKRVKAEDIDRVMADAGMFFLDVREPKEIEEMGSYEGFVNIPVTQLEKRLGELPKDKTILTA